MKYGSRQGLIALLCAQKLLVFSRRNSPVRRENAVVKEAVLQKENPAIGCNHPNAA
jgi:hypothetical protein